MLKDKSSKSYLIVIRSQLVCLHIKQEEYFEVVCSFVVLIRKMNHFLYIYLAQSTLARDQKQIYRLNATVSHWGLTPPPS